MRLRVIGHKLSAGRAAIVEMFSRSAVYRWLTIVSALMVLLTAFLPAWKMYPKARPGLFIPLHYDIYFGVDQFGPWEKLFVPAIIGLVMLLINIALGAACFKRERFITWFLLGLTLCIEIILLTAVTFMVLLNL